MHQVERNAYHDSFAAKIRRFMVDNAAAFNALTTKEVKIPTPHHHHHHHPDDYDLYGELLPLEYLMQVPIAEREKQLLKLITPGDIVQGHVILKTPLALGVKITSFVSSHKVREFSQLNIRGLIQHEDLAAEKSKCDAILKEMENDDVVIAVVTGVQGNDLKLSFSSEHILSQLCPSGTLPKGVRLGFREGEKAASFRKRPISASMFLNELEDHPGFSNPSATGNLRDLLKTDGYDSETKPTLIESVQRAHYPESDYSQALRKVQRHNWSMETVAIGVRHFKNGELNQAMKLFDHALDIDPHNVEGLVAKGALLANKCKFSKAIVEFEAALTINHTHKNARKYLVETQIAYGKELESEGKLEGAVVCYREAFADDASQAPIKARLDALMSVLERKAEEKLEKERREVAERNRMKKLRSIIRDEKEKKKKKEKKKRKKNTALSALTKTSQKKKMKTGIGRGSMKRYHSSEENNSATCTDSTTSDTYSTHSDSSSRGSTLRRHRRSRSRSLSYSPPRNKGSVRKYTRSRSHSSQEPTTKKSHSKRRYSRSRSHSSQEPTTKKSHSKRRYSRSRSHSSQEPTTRKPYSKRRYSRSRSRSHSSQEPTTRKCHSKMRGSRSPSRSEMERRFSKYRSRTPKGKRKCQDLD